MLTERIYTFNVINWDNGKKEQFSLKLELGPNSENLGKQACKILEDFQEKMKNGKTVENYQIKVKKDEKVEYVVDTQIWRFMEELADYMKMEIINN